MKKKCFILAALILSAAFILPAAAQKCGGPVSITSFYYQREAGTRYGIGLEAGAQGIETPFGLYAGVNYARFTDAYQKKDSSSFDFKSNFYLKGTLRVTREEGVGSVYLVASPSLNFQSGLDMETGLRVMVPIAGKVGIGVEPLYSLKQKQVSVKFMVAF